jgi:hypothetical protein
MLGRSPRQLPKILQLKHERQSQRVLLSGNHSLTFCALLEVKHESTLCNYLDTRQPHKAIPQTKRSVKGQ